MSNNDNQDNNTELVATFQSGMMSFQNVRSPEETLQRIAEVCARSSRYRGIFKRIDENREILQCLQDYSPEALERSSSIIAWLAENDRFLVELGNAIGLEPLHCCSSPRPWPGSFSMDDCYTDFERMNPQSANNV